jgi:hypothetical protein
MTAIVLFFLLLLSMRHKIGRIEAIQASLTLTNWPRNPIYSRSLLSKGDALQHWAHYTDKCYFTAVLFSLLDKKVIIFF